MAKARQGAQPPAADLLEAFADVAAAVESGAGVPEVARATSRALNASVAILDGSSRVLALACLSPDDERSVLSGRDGTEAQELRVAEARVGELRMRARGETPAPTLLRMVATLIALEVERASGPERAAGAAVASFIADVLARRLTDRENIVARANELGADLAAGASVVVVTARPNAPEAGDWRARLLAIVERGARATATGSLAAIVDVAERRDGVAARHDGVAVRHDGTLVVVVPGPDPERARRCAGAVGDELEASLVGYRCALGRSRPAGDPADLHRAAAEALLAANVAEAHGRPALGFEETGSYRLLLPAMSEDPAELERFFDETVAPLVAYDDQYQTELVRTLESFLDADGNVARTAERLFTHRHTIRYRLERVRDLTGLDVGSTDGRERLGLGLKAMRVLGILPPQGPAAEPGTAAGRVPREEKDR